MNVIERLPYADPEAVNLFGPQVPAAADWEREIGRIRNANGTSGLDYWLQPDSNWLKTRPNEVRQSWQDRWKEKYLVVSSTSGVVPTIVTDGTYEAFQLDSAQNSIMFESVSGLKINPSAFSFMFIGYATANSYIMGTDNGGTANPAVMLTANSLSTYAGGSGTAMSAVHGKPSGTKLLATVTFDATRGTGIRFNGAQANFDTTRRTQPTEQNIRFFGSGQSTSARMNGLFQFGLVFNVDLSRPEYLAYTARIETLLMTRFGVTA